MDENPALECVDADVLPELPDLFEGLGGREPSEVQGEVSPQLILAPQDVIADKMAKMEVNNEELLRATLASTALRCFGQVLQKSFRGELYDASFKTLKIDAFWSHSWHGATWKKTLVLLIVYNGRAALVIGTLAAALGMTLFYFGLLPSYRRSFEMEGAAYDFGPWGLAFGCVTFLCMLFLWQSRSKIFLDRVCMHQSDTVLKAAGIMSLGGVLRHSESMLVLWDPTYPTRLWTVFELAAFLKAHGNLADATRLLIRPTFMGTTAAALFVGSMILNLGIAFVSSPNEAQGVLVISAFVAFMLAVNLFYWVRAYFRWVDRCRMQLEHFSLADVQAFCCSVNHVDELGQSFMCDREIITACICRWFGSKEDFEASVRTQVSVALAKSLGRYVFPLSWYVGLNMCVVWSFGDQMVAHLRAKSYRGALVALINLFTFPLAFAPFLYVVALLFGYKLRRTRGRCCDLWLALLGGLAIHILGGVVLILRQVLMTALQDDVLGEVVWALVMSAAFVLSLRMWTAKREIKAAAQRSAEN